MLRIDLSSYIPLLPQDHFFITAKDYKLSSIKLEGSTTSLTNGDFIRVNLINRDRKITTINKNTVLYIVVQSRRKTLFDRAYAYTFSLLELIYRYYLGSTVDKPIETHRYERVFKNGNEDDIRKENMGLYVKATRTNEGFSGKSMKSVSEIIFYRKRNLDSTDLPDTDFYDRKGIDTVVENYAYFREGRVVTNVVDIKHIPKAWLPRPSVKEELKRVRATIRKKDKELKEKTKKVKERKLSDTPKILIELPDGVVAEKEVEAVANKKKYGKSRLTKLRDKITPDKRWSKMSKKEKEEYLLSIPAEPDTGAFSWRKSLDKSEKIFLSIQDDNDDFNSYLRRCIELNFDKEKIKELAIKTYRKREFYIFMLANNLKHYLKRDREIEANPRYSYQDFTQHYDIVRTIHTMPDIAHELYGEVLVTKIRTKAKYKLANRVWTLYETNRHREIEYLERKRRKN